MNQQKFLELYCNAARAMMLSMGVERRACITSSKITMLVFAEFGIPATPYPVSFALQVPDRQYAYVAGFRGADRERIRASAAKWIDMTRPGVPSWSGHLVVVAAGHMIDSSVDQAQSKDHDVLIGPSTLAVPLDRQNARKFKRGDLTVEGSVKLEGSGLLAKFHYEPLDDHSYLESDAWSRDPGAELMALVIARTLKRKMGMSDGPTT